jgi:uncharacterized repeat protein (TIGR03803 family)
VSVFVGPLNTAVAQSEIVLHSFTGGADGANPFGGVILDADGNLYGTTEYGGVPGCMGFFGCGTVFEITQADVFTVLYSFAGGVDGGNPLGGLLRDGSGNLYGTTCEQYALSSGTVFEITNGTETVLDRFSKPGDGFNPVAGLIFDSQGNLYGTTFYGGAFGFGTVFKLSNGTETLLHSFKYVPDGFFPTAPLVRDSAGNLYGTTNMGGASDFGTLFRIAPNGVETLLSFTGNNAGAFPYGGLTHFKGNLYGTTEYTHGLSSGQGTIFKVDPKGAYTVLYRFSGPDGANPQSAVVIDAKGNLYGTTPLGGAYGYGTVFQLAPNGTETVLHSFSGGPDGAYPRGGLVRGQRALYGTTQSGGNFNYGTVFKIVP